MNVVVHMTECKPHSTVASARVARFISNTLDIPLVDTKDKAESILGRDINNLIIVNGPMAFCDFLPQLAEVVALSKSVMWVQQDYTIMPPSASSKAESPFRKVFADRKLRPNFWTTCLNNVVTEDDRYINWNKLTYNPKELLPFPRREFVLYYGAFREKRLKSFERFFKGNVPMMISTTTQRVKKFHGMGSNASYMLPFSNVIEEAGQFAAALYIEDERSHNEFHSPANRFYEMLSAGVPLFFDTQSVKMLEKARIVVPEQWQVKDAKDLETKFFDTDLFEMAQIQREMWTKDYVQELAEELKGIANDQLN